MTFLQNTLTLTSIHFSADSSRMTCNFLFMETVNNCLNTISALCGAALSSHVLLLRHTDLKMKDCDASKLAVLVW